MFNCPLGYVKSSHIVCPQDRGLHCDTCGHIYFYVGPRQKLQYLISLQWPTHLLKDKLLLLIWSGLLTLHQLVGHSSSSFGRRDEGRRLSRSGRGNKGWFYGVWPSDRLHQHSSSGPKNSAEGWVSLAAATRSKRKRRERNVCVLARWPDVKATERQKGGGGGGKKTTRGSC